jgi:hypothetical protein
MTGYQSKKAAASAKLTIDRVQVEQWLEALKDIDALHHSQEPESADAQKAIADMGQVLAQPEQEPDVVMHWESHTWTINNPPPKGNGDVNLYYAPAKEKT